MPKESVAQHKNASRELAERPSDAELAPCPFCGGAARSLKNGYTNCINLKCAPYRSPDDWNRRAAS